MTPLQSLHVMFLSFPSDLEEYLSPLGVFSPQLQEASFFDSIIEKIHLNKDEKDRKKEGKKKENI
ncbi:MAG: hypothetical protein GWO20_16700 [Candidatus Korarchaeota archaeon]|nr:hypothetical protein [Candidatus Korarchaeota archaeon]